jgi:hypothetical protein
MGNYCCTFNKDLDTQHADKDGRNSLRPSDDFIRRSITSQPQYSFLKGSDKLIEGKSQ